MIQIPIKGLKKDQVQIESTDSTVCISLLNVSLIKLSIIYD